MGETPGHNLVEQPFPGVPKGGVAQIVAQGDGLCEILVQKQGAGHGACNARDLQRVGHPGAVMVPLWLEEHLGFLLQPAKRLGIDDTVGIPLEGGADGAFLLWVCPAPALGGPAGQGRQNGLLPLLYLFPQRHRRPLPFSLRLLIRKNFGDSSFFSENFSSHLDQAGTADKARQIPPFSCPQTIGQWTEICVPVH